MVESPVRLSDLLRSTAGALGQAGIREATREARLLWAAVSQLEPTVWQPADTAISAEQQRTIEVLVARRMAGEPLAHVTGLAGFRRLTLRSDSRALIPRPETEGLVELLLGRVDQGRVADLGTGTGCIALSLADEGRFERVIGVDWSPGALSLARENRSMTGLDIDLVRSDWLSALGDQSLDALISNPPYLTEAEYAGLEAGVKEFEPRLALPSGEDGLRATDLLLRQGARVLKPLGWIGLELDCRRAEASAGLARAYGWHSVSVQDDLYGRARYLLAQRSE